ncbi:universal stress protein [Catenulispora subtropica]|uniref:universal stress protein n=1 Tax=Catenulispora subtropica TaxID=450798 RepID=UPI0031E28326
MVVGYDRSAPSQQALLVAGREASLRHAVLTVVHAYHYARPTTPMFFTPPRLQDVYDKAAKKIAEEGVDYVRARYPDLEARPVAEAGPAAHVLLTAGKEAALLVVGNRGRGGFAGLLLGSVSIRVLGGASCPVIVAGGDGRDGAAAYDRVVAALDIDEPGCADVLAFASDEAAYRHVDLVAVYVSEDEERWVMEQNLVAAGLMKSSAEVAADIEERLTVAVLHAHAQHPEIKTSHQVVAGTTGKVLTEESSRADLVVVGAHRRHGEHAGLRIGPVATTLLHHAHCPVAVVPHG